MNRKDIKDKLDIEKAIEDMKTGLRMGCGVHLTISPVTQLFAVTALQEQLERLEGFEWVVLDDCANSGIYCSKCHKKVYKEAYANQSILSKYCPNCGRKAKQEN